MAYEFGNFVARPGVWPVMLTPFREDRSIDWRGLDALVDWYIVSGAVGLFAVCLSSEMYELSDAERLDLARAVVGRSAGRVPVIASGTFGGPVENQAEFVGCMAGTGVDAVVVLTSQLAARDESDDTWRLRAERLLALTDPIPLGLYECPVPYKRLISLDLLRWAAGSGRFHFLKDTSCELDRISTRCAAVRGTRLAIFNANAPTLLGSLQAGGAGFSGIAANVYPHLLAWLCRHFEGDPESAARLQRFLTLADMTVRSKYPDRAKRYLRAIGLPITPACRVMQEEWTEEDERVLEALRDAVSDESATLDREGSFTGAAG